MKFFKLEILSSIIPDRRFDIPDMKMVLYPSINKDANDHNYYKPETYLGLIIYGSEKELEPSNVNDKIICLIRFFNLFLDDHFSVQWLDNNHHKFYSACNHLYEFSDLSQLVDKWTEKEISNIKRIYSISNNRFNTHFNPFIDLTKIDFNSLFFKFYLLPENDKLRNKIELFSAINVMKPIMGKFYVNDNLQKGMMFILIESFINESIKNTSIEKECNYCSKIVKSQKDMSIKIIEFIDNFDINKDDKQILITSIKKLSKIRNDFFHSNKATAGREEYKSLRKKVGNKINIKNELEYGDGRFSGYMLLKNFFQLVLIEQLGGIKQKV